jgi:hypothetical protein
LSRWCCLTTKIITGCGKRWRGLLKRRHRIHGFRTRWRTKFWTADLWLTARKVVRRLPKRHGIRSIVKLQKAGIWVGATTTAVSFEQGYFTRVDVSQHRVSAIAFRLKQRCELADI